VLGVGRAFLLASHLLLGGLFAIPVIAIILPFVWRRDPERRGAVDRIIRWWATALVLPFFKVDLIGEENLLPDGQGCVFVANHQSFMDILAALHIPRSFKFISKASIFLMPVVGWAMKRADHLALKRQDRKSQVEVFRKSVKKLDSGASLFIFPEGTRSKDGKLLNFKAKGAFAMARRGNVPIVPVTILGTGRIMPSGKDYLLYRGGPGVKVIIHMPIHPEIFGELGDAELATRVRGTIASSLPEGFREFESE